MKLWFSLHSWHRAWVSVSETDKEDDLILYTSYILINVYSRTFNLFVYPGQGWKELLRET